MMVSRIDLAKAAYAIGGWLTKIKTYRRFYTMEWPDPDDPDSRPECVPAGRHWSPWQPSIRLLKLSMRLGGPHWDHFALLHEHPDGVVCNAPVCPICHGIACPRYDMPDGEDSHAE